MADGAATLLLVGVACSDESPTRDGGGGEAIADLQRSETIVGDTSVDGPAADGPRPDGPLPDTGSGDTTADAIAITCPPQGPFGTNKGDKLPNLTLKDCAGNNHDIHDLCGKKAAWIFIFRGS